MMPKEDAKRRCKTKMMQNEDDAKQRYGYCSSAGPYFANAVCLTESLGLQSADSDSSTIYTTFILAA
jgi:hypothetical protein